MRKFLPLLLLLCAFNRGDFNEVKMGIPASKIVKQYGEPYAVIELSNGNLEYEYIDRVRMNNELMYETHFFFTVEKGQIIDKRFAEYRRPGYDQLWQADPNYPSYP